VNGRAADSVEAVFREEWGRLLASLVRTLGDLDLAEEVASDAIARALQRWPVDGVPQRPAAWLELLPHGATVPRPSLPVKTERR